MKVAVAGGTGQLGRHVIAELTRRGHTVRALVRPGSVGKLAELGLAPSEVFEGDVRDTRSLDGFCRDQAVLFSCLGASVLPYRQKPEATFDEVDRQGNLDLIELAEAAGVQRFVYVSMFGQNVLGGLDYVRAHEAVVSALRNSRQLTWAVLRPTGFFSACREYFEMARKGRVYLLGDGEVQSNPVHDADLAELCAQAIEGAETGEIPAGGPEVLTRRRMAELTFEALGKRQRITSVPLWLARFGGAMIRVFNPRVSALVRFYCAISETALVAPVRGSQRLSNYYDELASAP